MLTFGRLLPGLVLAAGYLALIWRLAPAAGRLIIALWLAVAYQ